MKKIECHLLQILLSALRVKDIFLGAFLLAKDNTS